MFLPDCHQVFAADASLLVCARSLSLGTFYLATLVASIYAFQRILPIFLTSQWYMANLSMLTLTALQMALLVYECLIQNSPRVLVLAKYFRCMQIVISCVLFGNSAGELVNRSKLFYNMLIAIVGITTIAMTVNAVVVVGINDEIDCHHFTWMAMSITCVVLTGTKECDSIFFDDNAGVLEQTLRLGISIAIYLVPNWGVLYVFYVLPRFQFSTGLDVPGLLLDDEYDEEAVYELLPGDEEPSSSSSRTRGRRFY
ncbi:hypothetical protein BBO99_00002950 [Phytophthora kernoviae]|uniref:Uncharacterized protein n=2 Tax=Phytophthora kernoviae TaxID=325452 RepID=A0A3R7JEA5_9STRA|nr:hypothetical protein G195_003982 [Phytophthora kernoviae 00238/432]KAG2527044.1 hypothetical protein JM16_002916 [Phytophthora kernoviae]KAG2530021.1 hypothetical protein JM18_002460 [Phytophthora kernoviae]RLN43908.1 hypothetical protein BBI17_002841 [Phytophthora kernoviae]RLN82417.1 hypothetical protein BBO99_00002950 [Phytophthora kernoviae]